MHFIWEEAWVGIFGICFIATRRVRLKRYELKKVLRLTSLWRCAVTLILNASFSGPAQEPLRRHQVTHRFFYYYHGDNLGSSNILTDRTGQVVQHYEYATFGATSYQNNTSAFPISNRYTGQIEDDETGLYYYGARYYDPQLGRFIQPDTEVPSASNSQTLNRFSYCGNNPLNLTDPSGHSSFFGSIGKALGAAFSHPSGWIGPILGLVFGGPQGFYLAVTIEAIVVTISAAVGYFAGPKAGMITGAALSIFLATGYGVSIGMGMVGTNTAQGIALIASSTLGVASSAASLAGDQSLANDFSYAGIAMSTGGYGLLRELFSSLYGPNGGKATPTNGRASSIPTAELLGIGQDDGTGAQDNAIAKGYTVAWIRTDGLLIDLIGEVWKIATFGFVDTAGKQFENIANSMGQNTKVIGHSGGASSVFWDALFGGFNSNVTAIHLYSSPENVLLVDAGRLISGEPLEFEPMHWNDFANIYSSPLNPVKLVGGIWGLTSISTTHNINSYPNQ